MTSATRSSAETVTKSKKQVSFWVKYSKFVSAYNYISQQWPTIVRLYARYKNLGHLAGHEREKHLKVGLYTCKLCDETFPTTSKRRAHEVHVHPEIPAITCKECGLRMRWKKSLASHMAVHHRFVG